MKIFTPLYDRIITWSRHSYATPGLAGAGVLEACLAPIPTIALLIPMIAGNRDRGWLLSTIATASSVVGAVIGYFTGLLLFESIGQPLMNFYGIENLDGITKWYWQYGPLMVMFAGLLPYPFAIITISAGALGLSIEAFLIAAVIGRSLHFFQIALLFKFCAKKMDRIIPKWLEPIGWGTILFVISGYWFIG